MISPSTAQAQTPGLIYKPATNGGDAVLDPNRDGYVSSSRAGFATNDETESELPFRMFPLLENEVTGDLNSGSTGGHTDLVQAPLYTYFDGRNLIFRFRLGGQSTASKGYSVLIDADNNLSGTGTNPGFEFEVLLSTNFSVQILDHRSRPSNVLFSGSADQYHQRSIALSTASGDPNYFYDFYVPINAFGAGLTASTPLRMSGITVTSDQSGLSGTVADVGGINDAAYNYNPQQAWRDVVSTFPPTTLNQIQAGAFPPVRSFCPQINSLIYAGATTITGTTIEPVGTIIKVYSGSSTTAIGTTTTTSSRWSVTVPAVAPNTVITATAQATGETESARDCNPVTVSGDCARPEAPVISSLTDDSFVGTTGLPAGIVINIYQVTNNGAGSTLYNSGSERLSDDRWTVGAKTGQTIVPDGEYFARAVVNGCESNRSNYFCVGLTTSGTPTITSSATNPISAGSPSVSGTLNRTTTGDAVIVLFADGQQIGTTTIGTGATEWIISELETTTLNLGQTLTARAFETGSCSEVSAGVLVTAPSARPKITGTYCGPTQVVTGTSTETPGTAITVFATPAGSTNSGQVGTAVVNNFGVWTSNLSSVVQPGSNLQARATNSAAGKTESQFSEGVVVQDITTDTGLTVNGPLIEGDQTITGSYSQAGAVINVYIEGSRLVTTDPITVMPNGSWGVTGLSPFELFTGARVTATALTGTACESAPSAAVVVQCVPPAQKRIIPITGGVCIGSPAILQVLRSEKGVLYQLESSLNGTDFSRNGSAVVGTGGDITLTSNPVNQSTTFRVSATDVGNLACTTILRQTSRIAATPLPAQGSSTLSAPPTVCGNTAAVITITNTNENFSYQLRKGTTNVGDPKFGASDGGPITLITDPVTASTTYNVFVTDVGTTCGTVFGPELTIGVEGPNTNQAVTVANTALCTGSSSTISVATENNASYSYQIFEQVGSGDFTPLGEAFIGTGNVVSRTTPLFTTEGVRTYQVRVTNETAGVNCAVVTLAAQPTITITNSATVADAGPKQVLCGTSIATLSGNTPVSGTGEWSLEPSLTNDPNPNITIADPKDPNTTVSGLNQGYRYGFRWTISATCAGSLPSYSITTIELNCPSSYNIAPARYVDQYSNGDILATPSDPDAPIASARVVAGSRLPNGVGLIRDASQITDKLGIGMIYVTERIQLFPGTYTFQISLTDEKDDITVLTVTLTIYESAPEATPLPVDLVSFTASVINGAVKLDWKTASERNNDYFQVQRSTDGSNFESIGTIKGNGTTSQMQRYSFLDRSPAAGINYYRLKQVDYDGAETNSFVVYATVGNLSTGLKVYPNPANRNIKIELNAAADERINVVVFDLSGKQVLDKVVTALDGYNEISLELGALSKGVYVLTVESSTGLRESVRIVKVE